MAVHLKKREIIVRHGRDRKARPKTFKTLAGAEAYAKTKGYKKFEIVNLRSSDATVGKYRVNVQA